MITLTKEDLTRAIQAYILRHGKVPTALSGDASEWIGCPPGTLTWAKALSTTGASFYTLEDALNSLCPPKVAGAPPVTWGSINESVKDFLGTRGKLN